MYMRARDAAACVQYMRVDALAQVQGRRPTTAPVDPRPEKNPRPPVGIGSDTRQKGSSGRGRVVRPAVLIRAPARGGIVRRSREPPHARLNDLGSVLGQRGEHHSVAAAAHRLWSELERLWSAWWAGILSASGVLNQRPVSAVSASSLNAVRAAQMLKAACIVRPRTPQRAAVIHSR